MRTSSVLTQVVIIKKSYILILLLTFSSIIEQEIFAGARVKKLFLKDKRDNLYLIIALVDTKIALKKIAKNIKAPNLRFADAQLLKQYLGVEPGSVTPLGLINNAIKKVYVILDQVLFEYKLLQLHPLINSETITISPNDLHKFIDAYC